MESYKGDNDLGKQIEQSRVTLTIVFCNGGGFLSVKDAFGETGYPAFYR